jgi:hypothetical protein
MAVTAAALLLGGIALAAVFGLGAYAFISAWAKQP